MFIFKYLKLSKFIFFSIFLSNFLSQFVISDEKNINDNLLNWEKRDNSLDDDKIQWEKLNKIYDGERIKWKVINEDSIPESRFNFNKSGKLNFQEKINLAKPKKNSPLYSGPFLFLNSAQHI